MKIELSQEDEEFIKNLSHEMKTQDNRSTAQPYGLILTEEVETIMSNGYGDYLMARFDDEIFYEFDELLEYISDYFGKNNKKIESISENYNSLRDLSNSFEADELEIDIFSYNIEQKPTLINSNFFLTEKSYNDYLRQNSHNLNNPKSYGIHLTKNDEMKKLYEVIHKLANLLTSSEPA